jgi:NAD(P)-dependent dehydrogenase (short-subunit alcohol dehydrogenase family)
MIQTFNLENKIVLITGGYGYLGKAIVESLTFHNAKVYVLGRDSHKFRSSFKQAMLDTTYFKQCDVSNSASIEKSFENIFNIEGRIDVLINNAFYLKGQSPENMSDEDWSLGLEGTLSSVFKCIRAVIPYFRKNNKGKIINVSSMYGIVAPDFEIYDDHPEYLNPPHYGVSKAGIIQMTKYYASYLGKLGITVNTITPGPFPSTVVQKSESFIDELKKRTLLNRIGTPEDLAGAFVYLASDASNFMTGQNIIIDGGWTIK